MVVAIVRLLFVDEAMKLYRFEIEVVAIIPFRFVVMMPLFAVIRFVFMRFVEVDIPFTVEVNVFTADERLF